MPEGLPENWMTEPVGYLIPTLGPYRGLASDRTVVGDPIPVYVNPDGVLSLRPWREVADPSHMRYHHMTPAEVLAEAEFEAAHHPDVHPGGDSRGSGVGILHPADLVEPDATLDPHPWLFISDQVTGEHRSATDKGYHDVSGTYWVLSPRPGFEQDLSRYQENTDAPQA